MQTGSIRLWQRILAVLCAAAMLLMTFPQTALTAFAAGEQITVTYSSGENDGNTVGSTLSLTKGDTVTLSAAVTGDDSTLYGTPSWSSNDQGKVTVTDGAITAVDVTGDTPVTLTVTATPNDSASTLSDLTATVLVNVAYADVTSVTIQKSLTDGKINLGTTDTKLTATVGPENANPNVTWTSNNADILEVQQDGTLVPKAVGTATITATSQADKTTTDTYEIAVVYQPLTSLSLAYKQSNDKGEEEQVTVPANGITMTVGETKTLVAVPSPALADPTVTWSVTSDSKDVLSIEENGTITALKQGTATVVATSSQTDADSNPIKASCTVTISPITPTISDITLTNEKGEAVTSLTYGDTGIKLGTTLTGQLEGKAITVQYTLVQDPDSTAESPVEIETGTLTIKKPGTFKVKATTVESEYYASVEFTKEFTVSKKELTAVYPTDAEAITKGSDGKKVLTQENKDAIQGNISLEGAVNGDSVTLVYNFDNAAYENASCQVQSNKINGVKVSIPTPENADEKNFNDYYTLKGADANGTVTVDNIAAQVNPKTPDTGTDQIDLTKEETVTVGGVTFGTGILGNDEKSYWFDKNTRVTIKDEENSGAKVFYKVETVSEDSALIAVNELEMTESTADIYIADSDGAETGPYTVKIQRDSTAPEIEADEVKELEIVKWDPDEAAVEYTISVKDEGGSGVKKVEYYVSATELSENEITWKPGNLALDQNKFTVQAPAKGYVYVRATDQVGNVSDTVTFHPLVVENNKPTATLEMKDGENPAIPANTHTISYTVSDAEEPSSGIQKVTFTLEKKDESDPNNWVEVEYDFSNIDKTQPSPATLEDIKDKYLELKNDITIEGVSGTYRLKVEVTDFCGNQLEEAVYSSAFVMDNTPPQVAIAMDSPKSAYAAGDVPDNHYYKAGEAAMTVTFTDTNLWGAREAVAEQYSYAKVTLTSSGAETDAANKTLSTTKTFINADDGNEIEIKAADVDALADGIITVTVEVWDNAGNRTTTIFYSEESGETGFDFKTENKAEDSDEYASASFVLDKLSPVLTGIKTEQIGKGPYDNNYYYNDDAVVTYYTIEDVNLPSDWEVSYLQDGAEPNTAISKDVQTENGTATVTLTLTEEGKYTAIQLSGEDKAGNPLVMGDTTFTDQNAGQINNGVLTMSQGRILDRTAPQAIVTYSSEATLYLYSEDSEKETYTDAEGNECKQTAMYSNKPIQASIQVTDTYGTSTSSEDTPVALDFDNVFFAKDETVETLTNVSDLMSLEKVYTVDKESRSTVIVYGTDRAGNALQITEKISDQTNVGHGESTEYTSSDKEETYAPYYRMVYDITPPVATIDFNETDQTSAETHYYEEGNEYRAYYSAKTEGIRATFTVKDTNGLDHTKVMVGKEGDTPVSIADNDTEPDDDPSTNVLTADQDGDYRFTIYGTDKAGNALTVRENKKTNDKDTDATGSENHGSQETQYVSYPKTLDTWAPTVVIDYTNDPGDAYHYEEKYTYYNENIQVQYTFQDNHGLDENRVYTGYDSTAKTGGEDCTRVGTEVYANNDATRKVVSHEIKADAAGHSTDGHYNFKVYGEDKAGNPLTVTENNTTKKEATTGEQKGYSEEYCSVYDKVMDTINPVVTFQVATDAGRTALREDNNSRYYFNKDFTATYTIVEENYDGERITAQVGHADPDNYETGAVAADTVFGGKEKVRTYTSTGQGIYILSLTGHDLAGNPVVLSGAPSKTLDNNPIQSTDGNVLTSYVMAVDTVAPKLNVAVGNYYAAVLENTGYAVSANQPYRDETSATLSLAGTDRSPLLLEYVLDSSIGNGKTKTDDDVYQINVTDSHNFNGEQVFAVKSLKITDLAGNVSAAPQSVDGNVSNYIYLDVTPPVEDKLAPTVSLVAHESGVGRSTAGVDLYDGTVTVEARIADPGFGEEPHGTGGVSSGLYRLGYKVLHNDSEDWTDQVADKIATSANNTGIETGYVYYTASHQGIDYTSTEQQNEVLIGEDTVVFTFDAATFNYNDVSICVWAEDNTGHKSGEAVYKFGIDTTAPKIEVSYDNNDAQNEKYFKADRVATVVVTERNFNPDATEILTESAASISGWSYAAGGSANGDDDTWTCTVSYTVDGDYTFDIHAKDLVGHDAGEADYGASVAPKEFVIDKTKPVIEITFDNNDVRNGKYYNAVRTATIHIEEHNFSADGADVTTTAGIAEGSVSAPGVGGWSTGGDSNTAQVPFLDDGDYTMHVEYVDLAGNEAEPQDVEEFTVDTTAPELEIGGVEDHMAYNGDVAPSITYHDINYDNTSAGVSITGYKHPEGSNLTGTRSDDAFGGSFVCDNIEVVKENDDVYTATGSVSDLAGNTTEATIVFSVNRFGSTYILSRETQALVDGYYTNTPQTLQVTEINVSTLAEREVTTSLNGEVTTLTEGTDYTVQSSNPGWMQYDYSISASNFEKEGAYTVTLYSEDDAANANTNRAVKENGGKTNELPIDFLVDKTAPVTLITGVEDGKRYVDTERTLVVHYDDNTAMAGLTLYSNDQKVAEYDGEELAKMGGELQYVAKASNQWQTLRVVSVDVAGNQTETISGRFLLTDNLWVQYVNNKPLLFGSILLLILLFILFFLLFKRRKDKEEEQNKQKV